MIVVTVLPLQDGFPCRELSVGFERAESIPAEDGRSAAQALQAVFPLNDAAPPGYLRPHLYLSRRPKYTANYTYQGGNLTYVEKTEQEDRYVKLYIPQTPALPALALGVRKKSEGPAALSLFQEAHGLVDVLPQYSLARFDLNGIAEGYPNNHWLWTFKGGAGYVTGGRLTGVDIEKDALTAAVKKGSMPNEVGVTLEVDEATLKVRILTNGKVQFTQFTDEHLVKFEHPELGNPWPMILHVLQTLKLFQV